MENGMQIVKVDVRRKPWGEWCCEAWVQKDSKQVRYPQADYFTDDREDAIDTRIIMLEQTRDMEDDQ